MLIKVFSVLSMFEHVSKAEHALFTGVLEEEGGGTGLLNKGGDGGAIGFLFTCLVAKQAVEFPQVLASIYNNMLVHPLLKCSYS